MLETENVGPCVGSVTEVGGSKDGGGGWGQCLPGPPGPQWLHSSMYIYSCDNVFMDFTFSI